MGTEVGIRKSFSIPTPLNLFGNEVGNRGEIFNEVENRVDLPTSTSPNYRRFMHFCDKIIY